MESLVGIPSAREAACPLVIWHTEGTAISGLLSWMWRLKKSLPEIGIDLTLVSLEIQPFCFPQVCDPSALYDVRIRTPQEFLAFLKKNSSAAHLINHAYGYVDLLESLHPALLARLKLIGICHTDQDYYYNNLIRLDGRLAGLIAVSPFCMAKLEKALPHRQGTIPVLPDWDMSVPVAPHVRNRDKELPLRVLFNGRLLHVQKRVLELPEISRQLATAQVPIELTIVGDGPDLPRLREAFNLGHHIPCRFLGPRAPWEMAPLLDEHDIFLQISEFEGASVSLMEAMVAGLVPVVTGTKSGAELLKNNENSLVSTIGDAPAIAANLALLTKDRSRVDRLGRAACETAKTYLHKLNYAGELRRYLTGILAID
jgi:glycosyltransferase involved in cell wall biosynthesis